MGVTYSTEASGAQEELLMLRKDRLRLPFAVAQRLVVAYLEHAVQPILDEAGLRSLFAVSLRPYIVEDPEGRGKMLDEVLEAAWTLFGNSSTVFAQEIIVCIVLLCDASWSKRLSLIFDTFKCLGLEELYHEDLQLCSQVAAQALFKLWRVPPREPEELPSLTEAIADHAFLKLDKDLSEPVARDGFISWSLDRFREHRVIATSEALRLIYETTYT